MVESPDPISESESNGARQRKSIIETRGLSVRASDRQVLRDINLSIPAQQVFGIMGPSGSGKSTLLKCLNRLIELTPGLRVTGDVQFHRTSIFASSVGADALRARIGILFQQPVVFPKSIFQNVVFGVRHLGQVPRKEWADVAERALREAALWDEVKDRLKESANRLSVGQQQRLCLARTLAVNPEVILMDEPTSALDVKSAEAIEALILNLKRQRTIVLVTHNLGQARRLSDLVARIALRDQAGEIVGSGRPDEVLRDWDNHDIQNTF
jgi:phosphate transport system ATP-binding protein